MKKIKQYLLIAFAMIIMATVSVPAGAATTNTNTKPTISFKKYNMMPNQTKTLKMKNTKAKVTWKSSNKKVATVSSKGKVTAKSVGKTTISAKVKIGSKNQTFKCVITVSDTHKHNWEPVIKKIWVDEKGHYETKKEPYTDYEYTYTTYNICSGCGERFETDADIIAHFEQQKALVETTGEFGQCAFASHMVYEDEVKTPVTKYNEVVVWVVDEPGHYDEKINGYKCRCGKTKN